MIVDPVAAVATATIGRCGGGLKPEVDGRSFLDDIGLRLPPIESVCGDPIPFQQIVPILPLGDDTF